MGGKLYRFINLVHYYVDSILLLFFKIILVVSGAFY